MQRAELDTIASSLASGGGSLATTTSTLPPPPLPSTTASTTKILADYEDYKRSAEYKDMRKQGCFLFEVISGRLEEFVLLPSLIILRRFLADREIRAASFFPFEFANFFTSIMQSWQLLEIKNGKPVRVSLRHSFRAKVQAYVTKILEEFIMNDIIPSYADEHVDLLKQTDLCCDILDILEKILSSIFAYDAILPKADFTTLSAELKNKRYFVDVKGRLSNLIKDSIKLLRVEDWKRCSDSPSSVIFFSDVRYGDLKKVNDVFVKIDAHGVKLSTYTDYIETPFLKSLEDFYLPKIRNWKSLPVFTFPSTDSYLHYVVASYKLEQARCRECLDKSSFHKVDMLLIDAFVHENFENIKISLTEIFGDIFSFDRWYNGDFKDPKQGYADNRVMDMARCVFEMLNEYDKDHNPKELPFTHLVADIFSNIVKSSFIELIKRCATKSAELKHDKKNNDKFFVKFFNLFDRFQLLEDDFFKSNELIKRACINNVYDIMANDRIPPIPVDKAENPIIFGRKMDEALSWFFDSLMSKKKSRENPEIEALNEHLLANVLKFCSFLADRETFTSSYYLNYLFFRITEGNFTLDKERETLGALGKMFTVSACSKLTSLLGTLIESDRLADDFKEYQYQLISDARASGGGSGGGDGIGNEGGIVIENPKFLFAHNVPNQKPIVMLAPEITPAFLPFLRAFENMQKFYEAHCNSIREQRYITMLTTNGTCEIKVDLKNPKLKTMKEFTITTGFIQGYILSLFDERICGEYIDRDNYLTLRQIQEIACIDEQEADKSLDMFKRVLLELVAKKILIMPPPETTLPVVAGEKRKEYSAESRFKANPNHEVKNKRVDIPAMRWEDNSKFKDNTKQALMSLLKSANIRVLKSRKQLRYNDLFVAVAEQIRDRFKIEKGNRAFRYAIDYLVQDGWIKRDEDDTELIVYLG